jgi:hypothetical protein
MSGDSKRYRSISTLLRTEEASWIAQQHRAFMGWCNLKLTGTADTKHAPITDLEKDFADGIQV